MKRLFASISLLLMSLAVQSQTITRKELLTDSVVVIPKTIARWMLEDAEKVRSYEEEIVLLYGSLNTKDTIISKQDLIVRTLKEKNGSLSKTLSDCEDFNSMQTVQLNNLSQSVLKQKRRKSIWRTLAITAAAGIVANHLHWKYVKP